MDGRRLGLRDGVAEPEHRFEVGHLHLDDFRAEAAQHFDAVAQHRGDGFVGVVVKTFTGMATRNPSIPPSMAAA